MNPARYPQYQNDIVAYVRDILKISWTPDQEAIGRALLKHRYVMVTSGHSLGKCVAPDEPITLSDGRRVAAKELVHEQVFELLTLGVDGEIVPAEGYAEWNREEEIYQITTESGRVIRRNSRHPLWFGTGQFQTGRKTIIKSKGWTAVQDLEVGQLIAVTEALPAFGVASMDENALKTLAYLIGDGGFTQSGVNFTQEDNAQLKEFTECCQALGCEVIQDVRLRSRIIGDGTHLVGCNPVINLLRKHELMGCHSRDKCIPEAIFSLNKEQIRIFLSRLMSTDGWASASKEWNPAGTNVNVGYCSVSEQLVRDVSDLMLRFGICGRIRYRPEVNAWEWFVSKSADIIKFTDEISIFGKEEAVAHTRKIAKILDASKRSEKWRHLKSPIGTRWEKIKSIECTGKEMTVAIEVPGYHTYLTQFYEHNSHLAGGVVNWFYDCFNPAIAMTTAGTGAQVSDVVWKEIRKQRRRVPDGMGDFLPKAPRIQNSEDHFAQGLTAKDADALQGRKEKNFLIIFDEATTIESEFWEAAHGMLTGKNVFWLVLLNPLSTSTRAYQEWRKRTFHKIHLSCLNHPNILAEMQGLEPPFPDALTLRWVQEHVELWCDQVPVNDRKATDFEFPPESGKIWRPSGEAEARLLGRWPSDLSTSIWSQAMWDVCLRRPQDGRKPDPMPDSPVEIGCDVAREGDDYSSFIVRRGNLALHHETYNGWRTNRVAQHLKDLATEFGRAAGMQPEKVAVKIDDDGVGGGVVDQKGNFNFIGVTAASRANEPERYPRRRDELWFSVAERASAGRIDVSRLSDKSQEMLQLQLMAPAYSFDGEGRRKVDQKSVTKKLIGRSPDDADAFNLAFASEDGISVKMSVGAARVLRDHFGKRRVVRSGW